MKSYKVQVTCGAYNAPTIYLTASSEKDAMQMAKQRSGLSRFDNWVFIPRQYN